MVRFIERGTKKIDEVLDSCKIAAVYMRKAQ
jgi:hypothetical protein